MERTYTDGKVIYVGELELKRILMQLIKRHGFFHKGEMPERIVIPTVSEVDGVIIEQEVKDAVGS